MGQSDDETEKRYEELCLDLNMDKNAKDDAWNSFERISHSYTLEASARGAFLLSISHSFNLTMLSSRVSIFVFVYIP